MKSPFACQFPVWSFHMASGFILASSASCLCLSRFPNDGGNAGHLSRYRWIPSTQWAGGCCHDRLVSHAYRKRGWVGGRLVVVCMLNTLIPHLHSPWQCMNMGLFLPHYPLSFQWQAEVPWKGDEAEEQSFHSSLHVVPSLGPGPLYGHIYPIIPICRDQLHTFTNSRKICSTMEPTRSHSCGAYHIHEYNSHGVGLPNISDWLNTFISNPSKSV